MRLGRAATASVAALVGFAIIGTGAHAEAVRPSGTATITTSAQDDVNPAKPVTVAISDGTLSSVVIRNSAGTVVTGAMSPDATSWHSTEDLGYSKTYSLVAEGHSATGDAVSTTATITTLTPANMTLPYMQRIGGGAITKGATYGVGFVPIVHFDEPIPNRAAAERALTVKTNKPVQGSWYWADAQNVHFRPKTYWPAGTRVSITAKVYGTDLGNGLYGQADVGTSFTIGRRQVTVAYDNAPKGVDQVLVYNAAGHVIRTMNTSMGQHGGEEVNGNWINFYTLSGAYTVIGHEQPARMCSASYGLPADAPNGYACENIYNATRIDIGGIYLHQLTTTIWAQDHGQDVSHGCLNLNTANSLWFFQHSIVGDPVVIHGAKGAPRITLSDGGDWSVPWSTWRKGSAL